MTPTPVDASQRQAAKVAGFAYLLALAIVIISNYGISFRLLVPGDAVETARNILAHQTLFRLNIACDLLYALTVMTLLTALHAILAPVNRGLSRVAALCRLFYALMFVLAALNMMGSLRILGDAAYLPVFKADQLQTLARLHLSTGWDAYYIGLPFWGLASTLGAALLFKSGYIPKALSAYGVLASAWCVFCAFAFLIFPDFSKTVGLSWFDLPLVVFELSAGVWLLVKGLRPAAMQK